MTIRKRVEELETRTGKAHPVHVPIIGAEAGETSDEAVARYVTEHGPLADVPAGHVNAVVIVGVAPSRVTA